MSTEAMLRMLNECVRNLEVATESGSGWSNFYNRCAELIRDHGPALAEMVRDADRYRAIRSAVPAESDSKSIWPIDGYVFAMRFDHAKGMLPSQHAIGGEELDAAIDEASGWE